MGIKLPSRNLCCLPRGSIDQEICRHAGFLRSLVFVSPATDLDLMRSRPRISLELNMIVISTVEKLRCNFCI